MHTFSNNGKITDRLLSNTYDMCFKIEKVDSWDLEIETLIKISMIDFLSQLKAINTFLTVYGSEINNVYYQWEETSNINFQYVRTKSVGGLRIRISENSIPFCFTSIYLIFLRVFSICQEYKFLPCYMYQTNTVFSFIKLTNFIQMFIVM